MLSAGNSVVRNRPKLAGASSTTVRAIMATKAALSQAENQAVDALGPKPGAAQHRHQLVDRLVGEFGGVAFAGKALFLVVADQLWAALARHFDQRHAGIVRPRSADAAEIERLAAVELCPQRLEAVRREAAIGAMNAAPGAKTFEQRQRQPKGRSAKPRVPGTDTHGNYRRRLQPFNVSAISAPTARRKACAPQARNRQCSRNSPSMARISAGLISRACATVTECSGPSSFSSQKLRNLFSAGKFGQRS